MKEDGQEASVHNEGVREPARKCNASYIDIKAHAGAYIIVNVFLLVVWKMSNVKYPWPLWVIAGWGTGLAAHIWGRLLGRMATR